MQKFAKFWRALSRLYQNKMLQENVRLTAFFKLCKMCTLLHQFQRRSTTIFPQEAAPRRQSAKSDIAATADSMALDATAPRNDDKLGILRNKCRSSDEEPRAKSYLHFVTPSIRPKKIRIPFGYLILSLILSNTIATKCLDHVGICLKHAFSKAE